MQASLWSGAAACVVLAVASGVAQALRGRRRELDRIGVVSWPTVQFAAIMGAVLLAMVALKS
jgi:negative regulator of sigma E activity